MLILQAFTYYRLTIFKVIHDIETEYNSLQIFSRTFGCIMIGQCALKPVEEAELRIKQLGAFAFQQPKTITKV